MSHDDHDRLVFEQMIATLEARTDIARAYQILDESIARTKFNRERAAQIFLFLVDNCAHRFFRDYPDGAAVLFPKRIRKPFASELTQEFIRSRNDIDSQRPARRGVFRYLLGP
jgi:hypothetical protein